MPALEVYRRQVRLLLAAIPAIAAEKDFALKGGTAINLFVRDMPRLSVDIDLAYLPVADRAASLTGIDAAMKRIAEHLAKLLPRAQISPVPLPNEKAIAKLHVQSERAQIKIEVTPVLRGCVYEPETRRVSARVEEEFGFAETTVVSWPDLYAGKLVAALDRQHPRDLFDVRELMAKEGLTPELRTAFIVYLVSATRPLAEILRPTERDIGEEFRRGFDGMTQTAVTHAELVQTRRQLIDTITQDMPAAHKRFLLSFKRGEPDWSLLDIPQAAALPAVQWRLENLAKAPAARRAELMRRLEEVLG